MPRALVAHNEECTAVRLRANALGHNRHTLAPHLPFTRPSRHRGPRRAARRAVPAAAGAAAR
eukprot:scaffold74655_cov69-Phaeocystis_antarctica.AAC.1